MTGDTGRRDESAAYSAARRLGEQLASWGKVALVTTRGRRTGREVNAAVGFVEEADGSILVAAGDPEADWALNLEADPSCRVTVGERSWVAIAEPLERPDHARAIRELILRYGTPAEQLGLGPAFRLRPVTETSAATAEQTADAAAAAREVDG